jgi:hypothetical protein
MTKCPWVFASGAHCVPSKPPRICHGRTQQHQHLSTTPGVPPNYLLLDFARYSSYTLPCHFIPDLESRRLSKSQCGSSIAYDELLVYIFDQNILETRSKRILSHSTRTHAYNSPPRISRDCTAPRRISIVHTGRPGEDSPRPDQRPSTPNNPPPFSSPQEATRILHKSQFPHSYRRIPMRLASPDSTTCREWHMRRIPVDIAMRYFQGAGVGGIDGGRGSRRCRGRYLCCRL